MICRLKDSQPPRNVAVGFSTFGFVRDALEEETQIDRINFKVLIESVPQQLAVAEGVGPMRAGIADVDRTGERFFFRRRERFTFAVEPVGQIGLVVTSALVLPLD